MKYLRQFWLILMFSFVGELLKYMIPLPVPASIYGMVLLFIGLETGIIKLAAVKETAQFLIEIMPLLFIPAGVGLLDSWGVLQPVIVPIVVILVVSTIIVMVVSGRVTQFFLRMDKKKEEM